MRPEGGPAQTARSWLTWALAFGLGRTVIKGAARRGDLVGRLELDPACARTRSRRTSSCGRAGRSPGTGSCSRPSTTRPAPRSSAATTSAWPAGTASCRGRCAACSPRSTTTAPAARSTHRRCWPWTRPPTPATASWCRGPSPRAPSAPSRSGPGRPPRSCSTRSRRADATGSTSSRPTPPSCPVVVDRRDPRRTPLRCTSSCSSGATAPRSRSTRRCRAGSTATAERNVRALHAWFADACHRPAAEPRRRPVQQARAPRGRRPAHRRGAARHRAARARRRVRDHRQPDRQRGPPARPAPRPARPAPRRPVAVGQRGRGGAPLRLPRPADTPDRRSATPRSPASRSSARRRC